MRTDRWYKFLLLQGSSGGFAIRRLHRKQAISKLAKKMGWNVKTRKNILDSFIETRPKNVEISDDDILEELKAVRSSTPLPVSGKRPLT